jgi:hypothetical protein
MPHNTFQAMAGLSRRRAVAGLGALTGALTLGRSQGVAARQETSSLADHPMTGTWLAMANQAPGTPQVPAPSYLGADGSVLLMLPLTQVGRQGAEVSSPYLGTWEADDAQTAHFTAVQLLSDVDGTFRGSVTVDGYPKANADGQTFIDDNARVLVTVRDATGAVVEQVSGAGAPPVTGMRMAPGAPGFPEPPGATPAADA